MPHWRWKSTPALKETLNKSHKLRALSYEWTPPVPEKTHNDAEGYSITVEGPLDGPPPYDDTKSRHLPSPVSMPQLQNPQRTSSNPSPSPSYRSRDQDIIHDPYFLRSSPSFSPSIMKSSTRKRKSHEKRYRYSDWDSDWSSDNDDDISSSSSCETSVLEDFLDNIYLDKGSRGSSRSSTPRMPSGQLPPVYGLSFPDVPETSDLQVTIDTMIQNNMSAMNHNLKRVQNISQRARHDPQDFESQISQLKQAFPSPPSPSAPRSQDVRPFTMPLRTKSRARITTHVRSPTLDERIELLSRELAILTASRSELQLNKTAKQQQPTVDRRTMMKAAARKRDIAFARQRQLSAQNLSGEFSD